MSFNLQFSSNDNNNSQSSDYNNNQSTEYNIEYSDPLEPLFQYEMEVDSDEFESSELASTNGEFSEKAANKVLDNVPQATLENCSEELDQINQLLAQNIDSKCPIQPKIESKSKFPGLCLKPKSRRETSTHNMIEKRYRNKINDKITMLRSCVPSLKSVPLDDSSEPVKRLSKATILIRATEYIKSLEAQNRALQRENRMLRLKEANRTISSTSIEDSLDTIPKKSMQNSPESSSTCSVSPSSSSSLATPLKRQKIILGSAAAVISSGILNDTDSSTKSLSAFPGTLSILTLMVRSILVVACFLWMLDLDFATLCSAVATLSKPHSYLQSSKKYARFSLLKLTARLHNYADISCNTVADFAANCYKFPRKMVTSANNVEAQFNKAQFVFLLFSNSSQILRFVGNSVANYYLSSARKLDQNHEFKLLHMLTNTELLDMISTSSCSHSIDTISLRTAEIYLNRILFSILTNCFHNDPKFPKKTASSKECSALLNKLHRLQFSGHLSEIVLLLAELLGLSSSASQGTQPKSWQGTQPEATDPNISLLKLAVISRKKSHSVVQILPCVLQQCKRAKLRLNLLGITSMAVVCTDALQVTRPRTSALVLQSVEEIASNCRVWVGSHNGSGIRDFEIQLWLVEQFVGLGMKIEQLWEVAS